VVGTEDWVTACGNHHGYGCPNFRNFRYIDKELSQSLKDVQGQGTEVQRDFVAELAQMESSQNLKQKSYDGNRRAFMASTSCANAVRDAWDPMPLRAAPPLPAI